MISTFAWRNLWRNKLRSGLLITAVTLGIFAGVFMIAFMNGMVNDRIKSIVGLELSHIQIHQKGYLDNEQFSLLLKNSDSIEALLRNKPYIESISKRLVVNAMVSTAQNGLGVKIIGVNPSDEKLVTTVHTKVIIGNYLDENSKNPILISKRLAEKLKIELKNKAIITLQDINLEITGAPFRVVGIYETDNMLFDEANAFVLKRDLIKLTAVDTKSVNEIAIKLTNSNYTAQASTDITNLFLPYDVKNWLELSPEAGYLTSAMNQYMFIFIIVILIALSFGIVNTMLMVIMERKHEIGMLRCIGMSRYRVFKMIVLETVYLSLTGGISGIIVGFATSKYLAINGLNLYFWKEAFAEIGYSAMVYPEIDNLTIFIITLMIIVTAILSSIYPARRALKLNPADSVRVL